MKGNRRVVITAGLLMAGCGTCIVTSSACLVTALGGASSRDPAELRTGLSPAAQKLLARAYDGIDRDNLMDYHVHVVGLGKGGTGVWVNPTMQSWLHPTKRVQFAVYVDAAGVTDLERADELYVRRLLSLIRHGQGGKYQILGFDRHYNPDGTPNEEKSEFYVPNEYIFQLADEFPEHVVPVMSVHPYRPDALEELDRWADRGGKLIKWLPNAMGIDASSEKCDAYYEKVKERGLVILTHVGEEKAVEAEEDQKYGNPLLFRRPLDLGVKIIMAHLASLGDNVDLDDPNGARVSNFDLFMRLMDEKKYEGLLFGEISATTLFNRVGTPLQTILERKDLHPRLVNGSDYPLPAINMLIQTGTLEDAGYITAAEREVLNEIYDFNPVLFDFAVKRTLRAPGSGATFAPSVFEANAGL